MATAISEIPSLGPQRDQHTKTQRPGVTWLRSTPRSTTTRFALACGNSAQPTCRRSPLWVSMPAVNPMTSGLQNGQILRPDGTTYQGRDWRTVSTAYQF